MAVALEFDGVVKVFSSDTNPVTAVNNVSFSVQEKELFSLLGPSGCGKTTSLRLIAGLEQVTSGKIFFQGQDYTKVPPNQRGIGMVFQTYALYPHMDVFENVAYGLRVRKVHKELVTEKVEKTLSLVGLKGYGQRRPSQLSGGQQQRVALARALVYDPILLLLDEPLSNLDAKLRLYMRQEIRRIQQEAEITAIYVTHDQEEALSISDKIAVMNNGNLEHFGTPQQVYETPQTLNTADFIGQANKLRCVVVEHAAGAVVVRLESGELIRAREHGELTPGQKCLLLCRPERTLLEMERISRNLGKNNSIQCQLEDVLYLGNRVHYTLTLPGSGEKIAINSVDYFPDIERGQDLQVQLDQRHCLVFPREDSGNV